MKPYSEEEPVFTKASKPVFRQADTRLIVPWILVRTICSQSVCHE